MTQTRYCEHDCERAKSQLDLYIDNELPAENTAEISLHFEHCESCKRAANERRSVRSRLRRVVCNAEVPAGLEARIRAKLQQDREPRPKKTYLMAIAAAIAVCFGLYRVHGPIDPVLRIALDDHIHCAIEHHGRDTAVEVNRLTAELQPLLPVARQFVPSDMPLLLAHACGDGGRRFIHLTYGYGPSRLSVILTRRGDGEQLGSSIETASSGTYRVAAFQTRGYLVYTVSDLSSQSNARVLSAMAPALQVLLDGMAS